MYVRPAELSTRVGAAYEGEGCATETQRHGDLKPEEGTVKGGLSHSTFPLTLLFLSSFISVPLRLCGYYPGGER
jgi:hypothetical protein